MQLTSSEVRQFGFANVKSEKGRRIELDSPLALQIGLVASHRP
jgi:hypothetical protein